VRVPGRVAQVLLLACCVVIVVVIVVGMVVGITAEYDVLVGWYGARLSQRELFKLVSWENSHVDLKKVNTRHFEAVSVVRGLGYLL
jgi:hypothetical protein